jgi:hypothetical protein
MNNVGGVDRIARVIVGVLLILATTFGFIGVWGWIGVVPLATGLLRSCPLYKIFGFNTCPIKKSE